MNKFNCAVHIQATKPLSHILLDAFKKGLEIELQSNYKLSNNRDGTYTIWCPQEKKLSALRLITWHGFKSISARPN